MNSLSNNVNLTSFGSSGTQRATKTIKRVATKLFLEPTYFGTITSQGRKNTKVLVLPTCITRVKRGGMTDKILSFFSKSFREQ